ncbi:uncharacterized protein [Nicotiana sylvestris]|uniref:uncharacterized protein n=1 Tax=Nicotiana sylvestris TaxID=4096 RepID=UPI00388CC3DE
MGWIENMFKQMMEKNADSDAQLASHNTSICNLEVQLGQISHALNTCPKGALPSDTVVNPQSGNNTGHAMAVTTRSGKGGVASTSNLRKFVNDDVVMQDDNEPSNDVQVNDKVRIDIDENVKETQDDVNPSMKHVIDISDPVVPKTKAPLSKPHTPYPQSLAKQNNENQFKKFIDMMKSLSINVALVKAIEQIPGYAKFMKDLVTKKRSMNCEMIKLTHQVSSIVHSMAPKLQDPGAFTIPCTIGSADFTKSLCDLGASINLTPYSLFKTLGIGQPRPTSMRLQMAVWSIKRPLGIIDDVLVRVDKFILPVDFVILDCEVDYEVPIIFGRPFLATGKALVDVEAGELTFRVGDEKVVFHVCKLMRQPNSNEVDSTLVVLQRRKKAIGWTLADIQGISPAFCKHKIILEEDAKPSLEHQRRLNEAIDVAVRVVLGQRINKISHPVYYASKTIYDAQVNYTVTKKELLAIFFAIEKFPPYLMGTKVIVHTDHVALRYLMSKKDSKARLMRWVLLLQEFDFDIIDRKRSKNQMEDHLSQLEEEGRPHDGLEINDSFPDEQLISMSLTGMPWFADVANYLMSGIVPNEFSSTQRKKLK